MFKLLFCFLLFCVATGYCFEGNPIIDTQNGKVKGAIGETYYGKVPYWAFKGIPFALPPIDDLRFEPPQPSKKWDGILDGTKDKPMCIQLSASPELNEDCLYLSVYTPADVNENSKLPVMVWIYGGAFIIGSNSYTSYDPDNFLEKNVIVVSINYRVGAFGFLSTGDEVVPGNMGLKDQILGLKWVKANIKNFGGDPENILLFGQSAGAASVSYLMQTPLTKGLFHKTILESGSSLNLWALGHNKRDSAFAAGGFLGINTTNARTLINEMKKVPALDLLLATLASDVLEMGVSNPLNGLFFAPSVEPDGPDAIVTGKSYENLINGNFHHVPTIIGYTSLEGLAFYSAMALIRMYLGSFSVNPVRYTPLDLNIKNQTLRYELGKDISKHYDIENFLFTSEENILTYVSDDEFVRPLNKLAWLHSKFAPVYLYRFSYLGNATRINSHINGAAHGDEVPFLFIYNQIKLETKRDIATRDRMVEMWTNFAKYTNPTPKVVDVLQNVTWKPFTQKQQNYLSISDDLVAAENPDKSSIDYWEHIFQTYGDRPFDTY